MKLSGLENTTKGLRDVKTQIETQIETIKKDVETIDEDIATKLEEIETLKQTKNAKLNSLDTKEKDLTQLNTAIASLEGLSGEEVVVNKTVTIYDDLVPVVDSSVQKVEEE